ncbi:MULTISPECIES: DUF6883 domain-containing protein [unclassified Coleofasciculus]|uniref:DUF6883 domain-containing protein n=1 Tax=unclassified Coleofasciculus TaxID=2692782 RepID=UPI00187DFEE5|nr:MULTISPECIES: DUF6883 domain-containing protein [unclassified Coleofasciculus]MBE9126043.1 hypothetical protein [Coleofasciculus sp. LEGE 07081]MBE9148731.1 hypothetical protein [Coleofasciculus sp. LEGE 07092]
MKLPNPERAIIDSQKLAGYCLNPKHPDGQHKARVFKSALDLDSDDIEELEAALLQALQAHDAIPDKRNPYGQKYIIDFPMTRGDKQAIIHSVWIIRNNEDFPRLITCYVL